jgi:hypothetical protein
LVHVRVLLLADEFDWLAVRGRELHSGIIGCGYGSNMQAIRVSGWWEGRPETRAELATEGSQRPAAP